MDRYTRQMKLIELGKDGQGALAGASAAVVGCGGLGAAIAVLLARAGVGNLILIDRDVIEEHNLHRQLMYAEKDVGRPKAIVAKDRIGEINSEIRVESHNLSLDHSNIHILAGADIIVDGTDNLATRFLINDYAVKNHKTWVYGGAVATEGMSATFHPGGACFRCLFPTMPPPGSLRTCESAGVLGPLPTLVAALQASETLKVLVGGTPRNTLLYVDPWHGIWKEAELEKKQDCLCCVKGDYSYLEARERQLVTVLCDGGKVQITPSKKARGLVSALMSRYPEGTVSDGTFVLSADGAELVVFDDGRALIMGLDEKGAKSFYSRYVGW